MFEFTARTPIYPFTVRSNNESANRLYSKVILESKPLKVTNATIMMEKRTNLQHLAASSFTSWIFRIKLVFHSKPIQLVVYKQKFEAPVRKASEIRKTAHNCADILGQFIHRFAMLSSSLGQRGSWDASQTTKHGWVGWKSLGGQYRWGSFS